MVKLILSAKVLVRFWTFLTELQRQGVARLSVAHAQRDRRATENWLLEMADGKDAGRLEKILNSVKIGRTALVYAQVYFKSRFLRDETGLAAGPDIQQRARDEIAKIFTLLEDDDHAGVRQVVRDVTKALNTGEAGPNFGRVE